MPIYNGNAKMELLDSAYVSKSVLLSVFLISVKEANIQPFVQASVTWEPSLSLPLPKWAYSAHAVTLPLQHILHQSIFVISVTTLARSSSSLSWAIAIALVVPVPFLLPSNLFSTLQPKCFFFFLNFFLKKLIYLFLFLTVLGLRFCARAFSSHGKRGPLFIAVRGPLTIAASLVAEHRLQTRRLSSCGSRA